MYNFRKIIKFFKDLIIHFGKELKNLIKMVFIQMKSIQKLYQKYKKYFYGKSAQSEYEVLSRGLHSSNKFPQIYRKRYRKNT